MLLTSSMTSASGQSTLRFKRALDNGGRSVLTLTGSNNMEWAYGTSADLGGGHGSHRGSFSLNLVSGAAAGVASAKAHARNAARLAHGLLALLGARFFFFFFLH